MQKLCRSCLSENPIADYYISCRGKPLTICKKCSNKKKNIWAKNNRGQIKEYNKEYKEKNRTSINIKNVKYMQKDRERNPDYYKSTEFKKMQRGYSLKKKFGITNEDYDKKLAAQHGKCAICGIHQSEVNRTFAVDHNHVTGNIRAILCQNCNSGLGLFKENASIMKLAIQYLINWEEFLT